MQKQIEQPGCPAFAGLWVDNLYKKFGDQTALAGVSFQVAQHEIVAILGPSGCGKSTALGIIAGLEKPDQGEVCWNGASLIEIPTHQRGFGLMFQDFALFPHQNVFENIAFGLRMNQLSRAQIESRVEEVLKLVGLPGFELRNVNNLSGGEAQRVALARSIAPNPKLLMLDEPLGSLDRNLRERLMVDLRQILRESHQTAIYVTHDQEEAFSVADRIVLMNTGKVIQTGSPLEIYRRPGSTFAARFLGLENLMRARTKRSGNRLEVETPLGTFSIVPDSHAFNPPDEVWVLLRPDRVSMGGNGEEQIQVKVNQISFRGNTSRVYVRCGSLDLRFDFLANVDLPAAGEEMILSFNPDEAIQVFYE